MQYADDIERSDIEAWAGFRRDLYRILASLFAAPPHEAAVRALCDPELLDLLPDLDCAQAAEALRRRAAAGADAVEIDRDEFLSLSCGPTGAFRAPRARDRAPWCDAQGQCVAPANRAPDVALACGRLALGHDAHSAFDDAARQLGLLGDLWGREMYASSRGDRPGALDAAASRAELVRRRAGSFLPAFGQRVAEHSSSDLYRGAAHLMSSLVASEAAVLD
jgi:hypothetical protein